MCGASAAGGPNIKVVAGAARASSGGLVGDANEGEDTVDEDDDDVEEDVNDDGDDATCGNAL